MATSKNPPVTGWVWETPPIEDDVAALTLVERPEHGLWVVPIGATVVSVLCGHAGYPYPFDLPRGATPIARWVSRRMWAIIPSVVRIQPAWDWDSYRLRREWAGSPGAVTQLGYDWHDEPPARGGVKRTLANLSSSR